MKNKHRKIANELNLFNLSKNSNGMVMWMPNGFYIYKKIENYIREIQEKYGYIEVKSPIIANKDLWKKSGHIENFKENMFFVEGCNYAIKPMSCPFHLKIFNEMKYSYKQLPIRFSEIGLCHRNESSGSLNGLFRLREFNQDDGHIFCRKESLKNELNQFINMINECYKKFGFEKEKIEISLSLRPQKKLGSDYIWNYAENSLKEFLDNSNINYEIKKNEGAFYGPKIEFGLRDSLNRLWQCGVFQLDFFLAEKLESSFVNENNNKEYPIVLHRAMLGSIERFIAILLEHYDGKLPIWLNPNAISIIPVSNYNLDYALHIKEKLNEFKIKSNIFENGSLSYRIKKSFNNKSNFSIIIGDKEMKNKKVFVKELNCDFILSDFIKMFKL